MLLRKRPDRIELKVSRVKYMQEFEKNKKENPCPKCQVCNSVTKNKSTQRCYQRYQTDYKYCKNQFLLEYFLKWIFFIIFSWCKNPKQKTAVCLL